MFGFAGDDILEPGHESLLAKMSLAHIVDHRLPVGIETCLGVAFLGILDIGERRAVISALAGIDDPHAERTVHSS